MNDVGTTFNWSSKADLAAAISTHCGTEVIPTTYEEHVKILLGSLDDHSLKEQVYLFDTSGTAQPMNFSREEYVTFIMDTLAVKERMDDGKDGFFNINSLSKINAKKSVYKDPFITMDLSKNDIIKELTDLMNATPLATFSAERVNSLQKIFDKNLFHLLLPSDIHSLLEYCNDLKDSEVDNKPSTERLVGILRQIKESNEKYASEDSGLVLSSYVVKEKSKPIPIMTPTSPPGKKEHDILTCTKKVYTCFVTCLKCTHHTDVQEKYILFLCVTQEHIQYPCISFE